jgi:6-phosphogluconolactonase
MPEEFFFSDRVALFTALQAALVAKLLDTLGRAEQATLFVSGGTTPLPLYRSLAEAPLPWQRLAIALVDERWVDTADAASNERQVRAALLHGAASASSFTGMKNAFSLGTCARDAAAAVHECNARYARLPRPWSAALLGMGADGHTASLFPGAADLPQALAATTCCAALHAQQSAVTGVHTARMTLTPWSLLQCEQLFLLFTGDVKRAVYEQAKHVTHTAMLPVSIFLQQSAVPLHVYWCP